MEPSTAEPPDPSLAGYQVDDLIVDIGQQRVTRNGIEIPFAHLSFALLVTLARAAPNMVTFDQLSERVWPGLVITPETISQRVKLVRGALGDDSHAPRYIGGVRGRGYRMVAAVRPLPEHRPAEEPVARVTPYWMDEKKPEAVPPAEAPAGAGRPDGTAATGSAPPAAAPGAFGWVGALLIVLALLAVPWTLTRLLGHGSRPSAANEVVVQPARTIAVLPLIDTSPGGGNAYLGEGLAQELSSRLSRIRGLRVASRTSASAIKDRDVRTIAQALGVRHVLEGSVHREGDQLRVTAQLVDASTGYNVWSQTYNRTWQDLLAIEDDVARSITGTLKVVLNDEPAKNSPPTAAHMAAFDLYLAGLAKLHGPGGAEELEEAGDSFRRALAVDPKFALAYAGLCERYVTGYERTSDTTLIPQAESACGQALKFDSSLREVSEALAHLYLASGRFEQATAIYRELISSDPDNADGYIGLGQALDGQQRTADAERALRQAIDAEPTYWLAHIELGTFLFRHGRATEAIPVYRRVTQLVPANPRASSDLGSALEMTGDFTGAASAVRALAGARTYAQRLLQPRQRLLLSRPLPGRGARVLARHRARSRRSPYLGQPRRGALSDSRQPEAGRGHLPACHRPRAEDPRGQPQECRLVGGSSPTTTRASVSKKKRHATCSGRSPPTRTTCSCTTTARSWRSRAGTPAQRWTRSSAPWRSAIPRSWCAPRPISRACGTMPASANSSHKPISPMRAEHDHPHSITHSLQGERSCPTPNQTKTNVYREQAEPKTVTIEVGIDSLGTVEAKPCNGNVRLNMDDTLRISAGGRLFSLKFTPLCGGSLNPFVNWSKDEKWTRRRGAGRSSKTRCMSSRAVLALLRVHYRGRGPSFRSALHRRRPGGESVDLPDAEWRGH